MILRVVVAVALLTALVAASEPAVSTARADAADGAIERQIAALTAELRSLIATDDPTPQGDARRIVEITLPARSLTSAGVDRLRFYERGGVGVASWRIGTQRHSERVAAVPIRSSADAGVLREAGSHRLVFSLRLSNGSRALTVDRFKSETGMRAGHA